MFENQSENSQEGGSSLFCMCKPDQETLKEDLHLCGFCYFYLCLFSLSKAPFTLKMP